MTEHRSKDEQEDAEERWDRLAENEGHTCNRCGSRIIYDERDTFFLSMKCGSCYNATSKDD